MQGPEKLEYWKRTIEDWHDSGCSQKALHAETAFLFNFPVLATRMRILAALAHAAETIEFETVLASLSEAIRLGTLDEYRLDARPPHAVLQLRKAFPDSQAEAWGRKPSALRRPDRPDAAPHPGRFRARTARCAGPPITPGDHRGPVRLRRHRDRLAGSRLTVVQRHRRPDYRGCRLRPHRASGDQDFAVWNVHAGAERTARAVRPLHHSCRLSRLRHANSMR